VLGPDRSEMVAVYKETFAQIEDNHKLKFLCCIYNNYIAGKGNRAENFYTSNKERMEVWLVKHSTNYPGQYY
jgi:hypothetical protein